MGVPASSITILSLLLIVPAFFAPFCTGGAGDNVLYLGETLRATEALISGDYTLVMQANCNLVLYHDTTVQWSTGTGGVGRDCYVTLQNDGNLVLYDGGADPQWSSNSLGRRGDYICFLERDGNATIYGPRRWTIGFDRRLTNSTQEMQTQSITSSLSHPTNAIYPGEMLLADHSLTWKHLRITMHNYCKLALYDTNKYAWSYDYSGKGTGCRLEFGTDGQASMMDHRNVRLWWSGLQWPEAKYILLLKKDRTLDSYGPARWTTMGSGNGTIAMVTEE